MCTVPDTAVTLLNLQSKDTSSYYCQCEVRNIKCFRRQLHDVKSSDVQFLDIFDSSKGVTFLSYVLSASDEVLNGDSLLASIQV